MKLVRSKAAFLWATALWLLPACDDGPPPPQPPSDGDAGVAEVGGAGGGTGDEGGDGEAGGGDGGGQGADCSGEKTCPGGFHCVVNDVGPGATCRKDCDTRANCTPYGASLICCELESGEGACISSREAGGLQCE